MAIAHTDILLAEVTLQTTFTDAEAGPTPCRNVFHYRRRDFVNPPGKQDIAKQVFNHIWLNLYPCLCSEISLAGISVRFPNDPDDQDVLFSGTQLQSPYTATAGTVDQDPLPPQNAAGFLLRTGLKGKKHRGAKRFSGLGDVHVEQGYIGDTLFALLETLRDDMLTVLTEAGSGETWSLCVWNRKDSDMGVIPAATVQNDVTQILINRVIASQDSRKPASLYA